MSWNNKEKIETTCTVQQWRSCHSIIITASPFINQNTFTLANNAYPNRYAHYDLYLEYNLFQQIHTWIDRSTQRQLLSF